MTSCRENVELSHVALSQHLLSFVVENRNIVRTCSIGGIYFQLTSLSQCHSTEGNTVGADGNFGHFRSWEQRAYDCIRLAEYDFLLVFRSDLLGSRWK